MKSLSNEASRVSSATLRSGYRDRDLEGHHASQAEADNVATIHSWFEWTLAKQLLRKGK